MQQDLSALTISNGEIREKVFDGISTEVPLLRKAVDKMVVQVSKLVSKEDPDSNKRPKIPRIVGTIIIVVTFVITLTGAAWFLMAIGAIDAEGIGKIIKAAIP